MSQLVHACGSAGGFTWMIPVKYTKLTSPFGWRTHPIDKVKKHHNGIDLAAPKNTPIYATRSGTIINRQYDSSCGNYIKLRHPKDPNNSSTHEYCSVYFHMNKFEDGLSVGDTVEQGQLIGYVGTTGSSTGNHLHFGISDSNIKPDPDSRYWVDPELYIFGTEDIVETDTNSSDCFEKELPKTDNNIVNIVLPDSKYEGLTTSLWERRANILSNSSLTLFDGRRFDHHVGGGYSNIGVYDGINPHIEPLFDKQTKCPSIDEYYWLSKTASILNTNPYNHIIGNSVLPSNNAYCWGRVSKLYEGCNIGAPVKLCKDTNNDWFYYNKTNKIYDYGIIPRCGAIMCWTYIGDQDTAEKSCVAFVEEVKSTEVVTISMMKHLADGYAGVSDISSNFIYKDIYNYKNNWGMDTDIYKFNGFIYTLPDKYINNFNNCLQVYSDSKNNPQSTFSIALKDCKHYNKLRLIYDVEFAVKDDSGSNVLINNIEDLCNINIVFSQQVYNCSNHVATYNWDKTVLPDIGKGTFLGYPFPKGVSLLKHCDIKDIFEVDDFNTEINTYTKSFDETFLLDTYIEEGVKHNLFTNSGDNLQNFSRQLPCYIIYNLKSNSRDMYNTYINVHIHKIILYK